MSQSVIPSWLKGKHVDENCPRKDVNSCPWCKSSQRITWGQQVRGFNSFQCKSCEIVYIGNPLSDEAQNQYYQHYPALVHQLKDEDRDIEEHGKSTLANRQVMYDIEALSILESHKKFLKGEKDLKILDVGCAGGHFLNSFSKMNLKTFGIDLIDQNSTDHKLIKGSFPTHDFKEKFDFITFRGVMEHLSNPLSFLEKALDLLKDESSLIAITSTPNLASPAAEQFKEKWTLHGPESHIIHFKAKHFHDYFRKKGFRCIKEEYPYLKTPYSSFLDDIKLFADHLIEPQRYKKSPPFFQSMMTLCYEKL